MEKFKDNIMRFLRGRYGNDQFNNFIILFSLLFAFLNIFMENPILTIVSYASLIYAIYRMFSKDIWTRQKENIAYAAGKNTDEAMTAEQLVFMVKSAGMVACERDSFYREVKIYG